MTNKKIFELIFILVCAITGFNLQLNWFTEMWNGNLAMSLTEYANSESWSLSNMTLRLIISSLLFPVAIFGFRKLIHFILNLFSIFKPIIAPYKNIDSIAYYPLILTCSGYFGITINTPLIFISIFILQAFLIYSSLAKANKKSSEHQYNYNHKFVLLFFISGFSALIYQVVWQRILFQFFGVNIESVTIIVSIFMFGLGVGALIGGALSKKYPNKLLQLFIICEAIIGIFGLLSLKLFNAVLLFTLDSSTLTIAFITYALLAIPTICMGSTLPILIGYFHRTIRNVGKTVSILYFINTLGSALASFFTVQILFVYFGMKFSTYFAASLNIIVAAASFIIFKNLKFLPKSQKVEKPLKDTDAKIASNRAHRLRYIFILSLACLTGYIAMSQEIMWIRYISYATGGRSNVFGILLGCILIGIAFGSITSKSLIKKYSGKIITLISFSLMVASILYFLSFPVLSELITNISKENAVLLMYLVAGIIAYFMGIIFPLLTHYAIQSYQNVGYSVSWIYFANIIGSTIGPIFTGFFLLNWLSFEINTLILALLSWTLGFVLWIIFTKSFQGKNYVKPIIVFCTAATFLTFNTQYNQIFEKLYSKKKFDDLIFKFNIQNRSGVLSTIEQKTAFDLMIGGGIYDGMFTTDVVKNANLIDRAYLFAALKNNPKDVLEIGLSTGSWARVLANHQDVKSLDIVEINPGYLQILKHYKEQATILNDEKINIHIDDGRRWLLRNSKRFDFIVMNTTYHWRSQINNLVSKEFLQLCKDHLKEGGVMYYNTTSSKDIMYTTKQMFKYTAMVRNFIAGSDKPFLSDSTLKRESLLKFYSEGKQVFNPSDSILNVKLNEFSSKDYTIDLDEYLKNATPDLITDDNLASEYKTGKTIYDERSRWMNIFK